MKELIDKILDISYLLGDEGIRFAITVVGGKRENDQNIFPIFDNGLFDTNSESVIKMFRTNVSKPHFYLREIRILINESEENKEFIGEYLDRVNDILGSDFVFYTDSSSVGSFMGGVAVGKSKKYTISKKLKNIDENFLQKKNPKNFLKDLLKLNYILEDEDIIFNIEIIRTITRPAFNDWVGRTVYAKERDISCVYPLYNSVLKGFGIVDRNIQQKVLHEKSLNLDFHKVSISFPPHDISYYSGTWNGNKNIKKDSDEIYWIKEEYYERVKEICDRYEFSIDSKHPYNTNLRNRNTAEISSLLTITNPFYEKPKSDYGRDPALDDVMLDNKNVNIYISKRPEIPSYVTTRWKDYVRENLSVKKSDSNLKNFLHELSDIYWTLQDVGIRHTINGVLDKSLNSFGGSINLFKGPKDSIEVFEELINSINVGKNLESNYFSVNVILDKRDIWKSGPGYTVDRNKDDIRMKDEVHEYIDRFKDLCKKYGYGFYKGSPFSIYANIKKPAYPIRKVGRSNESLKKKINIKEIIDEILHLSFIVKDEDLEFKMYGYFNSERTSEKYSHLIYNSRTNYLSDKLDTLDKSSIFSLNIMFRKGPDIRNNHGYQEFYDRISEFCSDMGCDIAKSSHPSNLEIKIPKIKSIKESSFNVDISDGFFKKLEKLKLEIKGLSYIVEDEGFGFRIKIIPTVLLMDSYLRIVITENNHMPDPGFEKSDWFEELKDRLEDISGKYGFGITPYVSGLVDYPHILLVKKNK